MKNYRVLPLLLSVIISAGLSAQTADDVINNYLSAIGGQQNLKKITSLQMKSYMSSDMFEADMITTVLNGKGYKTEMDVMGYQSVSSFTDEGGWRTDPMAGSTNEIPEDEYRMGKGQIYVGGPWVNYKELGLKAELVGRADVSGVNSYQIRLSLEESDMSQDHFFDPDTHLLIRSTVVVEAQGYDVEMISTYEDYKEVEGGIKLPHKQEINYGGQMFISTTLNSIEVNIPVDPDIFNIE